MKGLLNKSKTRISVLEQAISVTEKDLGSFPRGHLRVSTSRNRNRYYHITESGDPVGKYLTKDHSGLAKTLAQKDYNEHFLKIARQELLQLEKVCSRLSERNADLAYLKLPDARKALVTPYIEPDELFVKKWLAQLFKANPYLPECKIYDTRRGDKVRSKSEAIIADMLLDLGIPYHYEKPIRLKGGAKRYPDFTLLKVSTRQELYLEHFGLLDDEDYRNSSLIKMTEYRQNGIYPGKNLLFTYETQGFPLDINGFKKMLSDLLLKRIYHGDLCSDHRSNHQYIR